MSARARAQETCTGHHQAANPRSVFGEATPSVETTSASGSAAGAIAIGAAQAAGDRHDGPAAGAVVVEQPNRAGRPDGDYERLLGDAMAATPPVRAPDWWRRLAIVDR